MRITFITAILTAGLGGSLFAQANEYKFASPVNLGPSINTGDGAGLGIDLVEVKIRRTLVGGAEEMFVRLAVQLAIP